MDAALLELLEQKSLQFITVKEICAKAGVNRSTFYLHYETIDDLLEECVGAVNKDFLNRFETDSAAFIQEISTRDEDELFLITPEYLIPYLSYVKDNRRPYKTLIENAGTFRQDRAYDQLFKHVLSPILSRYGIPEKDRTYIMTFHIHGLIAIINEWICNDCQDSPQYICSIMQRCVRKE